MTGTPDNYRTQDNPLEAVHEDDDVRQDKLNSLLTLISMFELFTDEAALRFPDMDLWEIKELFGDAIYDQWHEIAPQEPMPRMK